MLKRKRGGKIGENENKWQKSRKKREMASLLKSEL